MSKGTRFLRLAIPAFVLYVLAFFHVLPTPFLSTESSDAILPVVSEADGPAEIFQISTALDAS